MDKKSIRIKRIIISFLACVFLLMQSKIAFGSSETNYEFIIIPNTNTIIVKPKMEPIVLEKVDENFQPTGEQIIVRPVEKEDEDYILTPEQNTDTSTSINGLPGIDTISEVGNFDDVKPSDWFFNDVLEARRQGIVVGVGNNLYDPHRAITYAEYITILTRVTNVDVSKYKGNGKHWASQNIEAAKVLGIVDSNEVINWNEGIPRQDMVKFTCKALDIEPIDAMNIVFEDTKNISPEERKYINTAFNEYLTEGVGRNELGQRLFGYGQTVNRAQLATMALRIKAYKENPVKYKQERAVARQQEELKWQLENQNNSSSQSSSSQQTTDYVVWNGYKIPKGSVFYEMNKDSNPSETDFWAAVRFIKYPQEYDVLYNILTSKLDAGTVKKAIEYAKTKTDVEQVLEAKYFITPNGYKIRVASVYGDFTVQFWVFAPGK